MFEHSNAVSAFVKDWRVNGDLIYQLVGCIAGLLAIASWSGGRRPSELLADVARFAGAQRIGQWFESGLPPFLAQINLIAGLVLLFCAGVALLVLLSKPFCDVFREEHGSVAYSAQGMLGSQAACTVWVLLMFALQLAPSMWLVERLRMPVVTVSMVTALTSMLCGLAYFAQRRQRWGHAGGSDRIPFVNVFEDASVVGIAVTLALLFAVGGPILKAAFWLLDTESEAHVRVRQETMREREDLRVATGAAPVPPNEGLRSLGYVG